MNFLDSIEVAIEKLFFFLAYEIWKMFLFQRAIEMLRLCLVGWWSLILFKNWNRMLWTAIGQRQRNDRFIDSSHEISEVSKPF